MAETAQVRIAARTQTIKTKEEEISRLKQEISTSEAEEQAIKASALERRLTDAERERLARINKTQQSIRNRIKVKRRNIASQQANIRRLRRKIDGTPKNTRDVEEQRAEAELVEFYTERNRQRKVEREEAAKSGKIPVSQGFYALAAQRQEEQASKPVASQAFENRPQSTEQPRYTWQGQSQYSRVSGAPDSSLVVNEALRRNAERIGTPQIQEATLKQKFDQFIGVGREGPTEFLRGATVDFFTNTKDAVISLKDALGDATLTQRGELFNLDGDSVQEAQARTQEREKAIGLFLTTGTTAAAASQRYLMSGTGGASRFAGEITTGAALGTTGNLRYPKLRGPTSTTILAEVRTASQSYSNAPGGYRWNLAFSDDIPVTNPQRIRSGIFDPDFVFDTSRARGIDGQTLSGQTQKTLYPTRPDIYGSGTRPTLATESGVSIRQDPTPEISGMRTDFPGLKNPEPLTTQKQLPGLGADPLLVRKTESGGRIVDVWGDVDFANPVIGKPQTRIASPASSQTTLSGFELIDDAYLSGKASRPQTFSNNDFLDFDGSTLIVKNEPTTVTSELVGLTGKEKSLDILYSGGQQSQFATRTNPGARYVQRGSVWNENTLGSAKSTGAVRYRPEVSRVNTVPFVLADVGRSPDFTQEFRTGSISEPIDLRGVDSTSRLDTRLGIDPALTPEIRIDSIYGEDINIIPRSRITTSLRPGTDLTTNTITTSTTSQRQRLIPPGTPRGGFERTPPPSKPRRVPPTPDIDFDPKLTRTKSKVKPFKTTKINRQYRASITGISLKIKTPKAEKQRIKLEASGLELRGL